MVVKEKETIENAIIRESSEGNQHKQSAEHDQNSAGKKVVKKVGSTDEGSGVQQEYP